MLPSAAAVASRRACGVCGGGGHRDRPTGRPGPPGPAPEARAATGPSAAAGPTRSGDTGQAPVRQPRPEGGKGGTGGWAVSVSGPARVPGSPCLRARRACGGWGLAPGRPGPPARPVCACLLDPTGNSMATCVAGGLCGTFSARRTRRLASRAGRHPHAAPARLLGRGVSPTGRGRSTPCHPLTKLSAGILKGEIRKRLECWWRRFQAAAARRKRRRPPLSRRPAGMGRPEYWGIVRVAAPPARQPVCMGMCYGVTQPGRVWAMRGPQHPRLQQGGWPPAGARRGGCDGGPPRPIRRSRSARAPPPSLRRRRRPGS